MNDTSSDIYDALAPYYREYAEKKSAYLVAVDCFVLDNISVSAKSLLDVGSGDGVRAMALARQKGITETVLCDLSAEMADRCRALGPVEVWQVAAQNLPATVRRFDVITCLWNVLGHLPGRVERIRALAGMRELLTDRGVIFFDVNNRHNASAYGLLRVFGRIVLDFLSPDERRGDASFDWKIGDKTFPAMGHLFTPDEIEGIISASGLKIRKRVAVDYAKGTKSLSLLKGQLVYMVGK